MLGGCPLAEEEEGGSGQRPDRIGGDWGAVCGCGSAHEMCGVSGPEEYFPDLSRDLSQFLLAVVVILGV